MKSYRKIRPLLPAAATAALLCICIVFSSVAAVGTQPAVEQVSAAPAPAAAQSAVKASAAAPSMEVELLAAQEETTFPATVLAQPAQPLPISDEDLRQMAADAEAEAADAEALAEQTPAVLDDLVLIDNFTATAYCTTGTTATGTYTTVNRTLAVNPAMIPYGTHVWLFFPDGTLVGDFYAEDTGSNMMAHPYVIDIYKGADSYDECMQWGAQPVSVYVSASETN